MNHQPFRNWLLSEEALSPEQAQSLKEHLASCDACRQIEPSWKEVELAFTKSPEMMPRPGFTQRWQARLAVQEAHWQSRSGWLSIAATALVAVIISGYIATQVWAIIRAPGPYIAAWLDRLTAVFIDYFLLQSLFRTNISINPTYVLVGSFFLFGMISFLSVFWLTVYKKFVLARRIV
jgi:hypothetical protein